MNIDLQQYESRKSFVQDWYLSHKDSGISYCTSMMATTTMIPAIVVAFWIAEIENWSQESLRKVQSIIDFYGYTTIENKPIGSPI